MPFHIPRPRPLLFVGVLTLLAGGAVAFQILGPPSPREQIDEARATLRELRAEAESCRTGVREEEAAFRRYEGEVSALRDRIRALESLHPEGVPGDSYQVYLETVNNFNLAVPDWDGRADTLQAGWETCRSAVEAHNRMADSVLQMLETEGLTIPTRIPAADFPRPRAVQPEWDPPSDQ